MRADFALTQERLKTVFLHEAALYLRKAILSQELQDLPETLTAQAMKNSKNAVPKELPSFFVLCTLDVMIMKVCLLK